MKDVHVHWNYSGNKPITLWNKPWSNPLSSRAHHTKMNLFLCGNIFHNTLKSYIEIEFHHVSPTNFEPKSRSVI